MPASAANGRSRVSKDRNQGGGTGSDIRLVFSSWAPCRKKGTLNKLTADIRAGAISGFARHGSNGRGEGGFAGFCFYLAKKHPKAAARIVEKLLPLNVNATGLSNPSISTVNVISVPAGRFLSKEDMDRLQQPQLTIDAVPQPVQLEEPARCEEPAGFTDGLEALVSGRDATDR